VVFMPWALSYTVADVVVGVLVRPAVEIQLGLQCFEVDDDGEQG
jgi:hypothetical protein